METRRRVAGGAPEPSIQGLALFLPEIRMALQVKDYNGLKLMLREIHPVDLADGWGELTEAEQLLLFRLLDWTRAVEGFEELGPPHQQHLMANLDDRVLGEMLADLSPDDHARLFRSVSERIRRKLTSVLKRDEAQKVRERPAFPDGTAGTLMSTGIITLRRSQTIRQAVGTVQATSRVRMADDLNYFYVVDEQERLIGSIGLRSLITSPQDITIGEMMSPVSLIRVKAMSDQEVVARLFAHYDLISAPVVDDENHLLGVITANDIVGVVRDEATEDIAHMAGTAVEDIAETSTLRSVRLRLPWLLASYIGGLAVTFVVGAFEATLDRVIALAAFMPVILGMGGNVGTQSATLVVRGLALGQLQMGQVRRLLFKEIRVGLCLGISYGLLLGGLAYARFGAQVRQFPLLGAVVGLGICASMTIAATIGTLIPLALKRLGFDPAIATGPFVSPTTDMLASLTYFALAAAVL